VGLSLNLPLLALSPQGISGFLVLLHDVVHVDPQKFFHIILVADDGGHVCVKQAGVFCKEVKEQKLCAHSLVNQERKQRVRHRVSQRIHEVKHGESNLKPDQPILRMFQRQQQLKDRQVKEVGHKRDRNQNVVVLQRAKLPLKNHQAHKVQYTTETCPKAEVVVDIK